MPQVSTFCPRCGESIETEVPDEARAAGRAALACPSCRFAFEIAPPRRPGPPGGAEPDWQRVGAAAQPRRAGEGPAGRVAPGPGWTPAADPGVATGPPARSFKPVAAAMMLFFASVIGLWLGLTIVVGDDLLVEGVNDMSGTGNFTGTVQDEDGDGLADVQVALRPADDNGTADARTTTTDARGRYHFADTPPGHYLVTFRHANHTTVELETLAYPDEYQPLFGASGPLTSVTMESGDPTAVERVSMVDFLENVTRWMGVGITVAALLAAAGGVAALTRRYYPLAVIGAVGGILTFGFLVGSAISVIALVLVIMARKEFRRGVAPGDAAPPGAT